MQRLPIIIFLESHTDVDVYAAYPLLLRYLHTLGYNIWCLEMPATMNPLHAREHITNHLAEIDEILESLRYRHLCVARNIKRRNPQQIVSKEEIINLSLEELRRLLMCAMPEFSEEQHNDFIVAVRSMVAAEGMYLAYEHVAKYMQLLAIDAKDPHAMPATSASLARRNEIMAEHLEQLFEAGRNIVFNVGKAHYPGLIKNLAEKNLLGNTLFFDLHPDLKMADLEVMTEFSKLHTGLSKVALTSSPFAQLNDEFLNFLHEVAAEETPKLEDAARLQMIEPKINSLLATDVINLMPLLQELIRLNTARSDKVVGTCKPRYFYQDTQSRSLAPKPIDLPLDRARPMVFSRVKPPVHENVTVAMIIATTLLVGMILAKYLRNKPFQSIAKPCPN